MRLRRVFLTVLVVCLAITATPAVAWYADFFDHDASGVATYEEMVIRPQAMHDTGANRTYMVYQGFGMNPYAMAYDHGEQEWIGPYRIGDNPLDMNHHGAPALLVDDDGRIVVFFGGHRTDLLYARSAEPGDISRWSDPSPVEVGPRSSAIRATYPQPVLESDGSIRLFYRRDSGPTRGDWESVLSTRTAGGTLGWGVPEMVIDGSVFDPANPDSGSYWYVSVDHDAKRGTAIAAIRRDFTTLPRDNFMIRRGVYYLERSAEGTWTAAGGAPIAPARNLAALEATAVVVPEDEGLFTNQAVLRRDSSGSPAILFLAGSHPDGPYEWRFARWGGSQWSTATITTTDSFFDAGTFEFMPDGSVEAFLTTGGHPDDQTFDDPSTPRFDESIHDVRGGDIMRWRLGAGGESWIHASVVATSPGPHARYNNPQIVQGHQSSARLLFSEWNNDNSSFIQKVFLWGDDGFIQRRFTPDFHRLAGADRIATSIEIAKRGFPNRAGAVVIATADDFPDVLCGVPLAQAMRAPILLSRSSVLDPRIAAEIRRLGARTVVILGGESAISRQVEAAILALGNVTRVERVGGTDRFATSAAIARSLAARRGKQPEAAVLASGLNFADALTVSPYAARRGYPILLTPPNRIHRDILSTMKRSDIDELIVVGGAAAISATTVAAYEAGSGVSAERWSGSNRYETARVVAERSLDAGHALERFSVATGESFADAVGGGWLAARYNSVLLITPSGKLHPTVGALLDEHVFRPGSGILDVHILGGPAAISPAVMNELSDHVLFLDSRTGR